jgi:hypothetical protein
MKRSRARTVPEPEDGDLHHNEEEEEELEDDAIIHGDDVIDEDDRLGGPLDFPDPHLGGELGPVLDLNTPDSAEGRHQRSLLAPNRLISTYITTF